MPVKGRGTNRSARDSLGVLTPKLAVMWHLSADSDVEGEALS